MGLPLRWPDDGTRPQADILERTQTLGDPHRDDVSARRRKLRQLGVDFGQAFELLRLLVKQRLPLFKQVERRAIAGHEPGRFLAAGSSRFDFAVDACDRLLGRRDDFGSLSAQ